MRSLAVLLRLVVLLVAFGGVAAAQTAGWRAYPAYNEVTAVAAAPDGLWAANSAGLFFYGVPDGEIVTYTPVDGLSGGAVGAMAYDEARGALWIGYESGLLEQLDPETETVTPFYAIRRADQYPSRGIRRVEVAGDVLYLSTDFGVVVFDLERAEVRATYARIGDLEGGTPVNDVLEAPRPDGSPGLWLATDGGVFHAARGAGNLQAPGAWTRAVGAPSPAFSMAAFDGTLYVGGLLDGARDLYRLSAAGTWVRQLYINDPISVLRPEGDRLLALTPTYVSAVRPGQPGVRWDGVGVQSLEGITIGPGGTAWVGDAVVGLFPLPGATSERITYDPAPIVPPGPFTNRIVQADVAPDGTFWLVTERIAPGRTTAVNQLDDGTWSTYRVADFAPEIDRYTYSNGTAGPDGTYYVGSEGGGLTTVAPDGTVTVYGIGNSSLRSAEGLTDYVVVKGVAFEDSDRWVLNNSGRPLHLFAEDGTWTGLPFPSGIPSSVLPRSMAIDDFGRKWIALGTGGLGVWDTGENPASPADDRGRRFTDSPQSGQGLPDPDVRDVAVDREGRVWIGTARGLAYVFSPGSAFDGSTALATPQWARTEDGTSYLLRDVAVNDLEVDPAGQIWVATSTGAYLINAEGNAVVRQWTSANSPLPDDIINSVAVDPRSGRVYFASATGLFSVPGDATRPLPTSEALQVSPSPYRPAAGGDGVVVTGMASSRSTVRVMTVAGEVLYAAEVDGGSFRWDGRDARTGRPAASGVYLVVAAGENGETLYGKVAVIR